MISDAITALRWVTDLGRRGWNWYSQRSEKVEIEHLSIDYTGAETRPNTNSVALIFGLQFAIENRSTNLAEDVIYQAQVEYPPREEMRSRVPNTHVIPEIELGEVLGQYTFEPLIIRTDFESYLEIHDDPPNHIRTHAPFSGDVEVTVKVASSTHDGHEVTISLTDLLREWVARNEGRKIADLEKGIASVYPREPPQEEHLEMIVG